MLHDATFAKTQMPPGPVSRLPGGMFLRLRRDPLKLLTDVANGYGDIAYFKLVDRPTYLLNNPEHIRSVLETPYGQFEKGFGLQVTKNLLGNGLLTSEGEFHRRQRRLVQPAFHKERLAGYGVVMADYADDLAGRWQDGATVDIGYEMMQLTRLIVTKTLFDYDVTGQMDEIDIATATLIELFGFVTLPFGTWLADHSQLPAARRLRHARATLDKFIFDMIADRRASGRDHGDLLSMLLMSVDEEAVAAPANGRAAQDAAGAIGRTGNGQAAAGMTDREVRDEAITLFLAGHETTANALTWSWYLLAQHPEVEAKLGAELDAVLGGRKPGMADVGALVYTRMVLTEAMRLYPPAWAIGRRALVDHPVGGYVIPAGASVFMSPYVVHRDARYFPDPLRFDPERWRPETAGERPELPKYAYFPFGGGPRRCIGEAFAWLEGTLLLATLAQRWQFELAGGMTMVPRPRITLRPRGPIRMIVRAR